MEGVAAAASIAAILALVGQTIDGLTKLKDFYARLATASKIVHRLLQDINSLIHDLHGIKEMLAKLPDGRTDVHTTSLGIQVEACSTDTFNWLKKAQGLRLSTHKGAKAWLKRLRTVADRDEVDDIRTEISRHRQELDLHLNLIGRSMDGDIYRQNNQQMGKLDELKDSLTSLLSNLSRDPSISRNTCSLYSANDSQSLPSIVGSQSRMEAFALRSQVSLPWEAMGTESPYSFSGDLRPRLLNLLSGRNSSSSSLGSFHSDVVLRSSEQPKQWSCHMCFELFESMSDLNRHIKSAHHRPVSWSCGKLHKEVERAYAFAFNRFQTPEATDEGDPAVDSIMCGLCGEQSFSPNCQTQILEEHLKRLHHYDQCECSEESYGMNHFLEHLEQIHGALRGSWLKIVLAACSTRELFTPVTVPAIEEITSVQTTDASTQTIDETSSSRLEMIELQETLNRSNLLGHWSDTQDRINRWLLHSLVTDESQAQLHRSQMPESGLDETTWLRLVLRYWFIDEAATGVQIAYSLSGGAIGSRSGSSLVSSKS